MAVTPRLVPSVQPGFDFSIDAPAKVNPFLHVLGQRADGYHDLQVGFELLNWGDHLHIDPAAHFEVSGIAGLPMESNLVTQAARALARDAGIEPRGHLWIDKQTPSGAGLGGGSSDAASALLALRTLWGLSTSDEALATIGRSLGADVPVFLGGRSAIGTGIGEHLTPVSFKPRWLLLCSSGNQIPTPQIFTDPGLTRNSSPITIRAALDGRGHNDCEPVCRRLFPDVDRLFASLANHRPKLSGTGGTVFIELDASVGLESIKAALPSGTKTWVVSTTEYSSAVES